MPSLGPGEQQQSINGVVLGLDGSSVVDASVEVIKPATGVTSKSTTNDQGEFSIDSDSPTWLRVGHPEYSPRVRAVAPGESVQITLPPDDETITITFGGDVMFGRRFYEDDDDPLSRKFQINPEKRLQDHREILQYTKPLLQHADVTSVNLESPTTTTDWRHPEKEFTFVSHPIAAEALGDAEIDYTALGNNHVFDALTPGIKDTVDALDAASLKYSGAGFSADEAWEPAIFDRNGVTVAMISCTNVVGHQYDLNWSTDRDVNQTYTVQRDGETLEVPGSAGVAEADEERLREQIGSANEQADLVVVQIHGGEEYQREPTESIRALTEVASQAGADLIVNHHPHVTGGLEYINESLVAWSLGNFIFDQILWETLRSYVLTVHASPDGIVMARIDPVLLPGYVPKGVTGEPREKVCWEAAGMSDDHFSLSGGSLEYVGGSHEADTEPTVTTTSVGGSGEIYTRHAGWIQSVEEVDGEVRTGRDRLFTGGFGDYTVDDQRYSGPLWRFSDRRVSTGPEVGPDGSPGIEFSRSENNQAYETLTPESRLPIQSDEFTFRGTYRFDGDAGLELLISWYEELSGPSFEQESVPLDGTGGDWERFQVDRSAPTQAVYVDSFLRLSPPEHGLHRVGYDDLQLIEWADGATSGPEYDHLAVDGSARLTFAVQDREEIRWETADGDTIV